MNSEPEWSCSGIRDTYLTIRLGTSFELEPESIGDIYTRLEQLEHYSSRVASRHIDSKGGVTKACLKSGQSDRDIRRNFVQFEPSLSIGESFAACFWNDPDSSERLSTRKVGHSSPDGSTAGMNRCEEQQRSLVANRGSGGDVCVVECVAQTRRSVRTRYSHRRISQILAPTHIALSDVVNDGSSSILKKDILVAV